MLRKILSVLAVGAALNVTAFSPSFADNTNLGKSLPLPDEQTAAGMCDSSKCLLKATDDAGKDADTPVPTTPTGQPLYTCEYTPVASELRPTPDPHQGEQGAWVQRKCTTGAIDAEGKALMPVVGQIVWRPTPQPTTAALAVTAYRQLKPPAPTLAFSPPPTSPEIVGMQLWLAVSPTIWNPVKAKASAGAATVTATATPIAVTWAMGDGHSVVCHSPGTPYPANATARTPMLSPTCGYTYPAPSAIARGGMFPVTATVQWRVEWSGTGGLSGTFADLQSATSTQVKVVEVQALVTKADR